MVRIGAFSGSSTLGFGEVVIVVSPIAVVWFVTFATDVTLATDVAVVTVVLLVLAERTGV